MIGIITETMRNYEKWCKRNNLNPKDYIPIVSIQQVLGRKFDEVWEVNGLPSFIDDIGFIMEYLGSHSVNFRRIEKINGKELS